ncbi:hypothetical protein Pta6605_52120 [Pseudomonas amygdali pv. tabaci]|nr:hypothetical protein Pta6605_52120 [Pseudomonas amygdali pv. tabaci]
MDQRRTVWLFMVYPQAKGRKTERAPEMTCKTKPLETGKVSGRSGAGMKRYVSEFCRIAAGLLIPGQHSDPPRGVLFDLHG